MYKKKTYRKKESFRSDRPLPILSKALFESKIRLNKIPEVKNVTVLQFDNLDRTLVVLASVNTKYNTDLQSRLYAAHHDLHARFKKRGINLDVSFGW
ncbi:hypothetical protein LCGC14_0944330 [marine sediment metagenome]|uniref:Uncharacterized protein n=1 Tax=marine sediment metagenome TaxID=412755 RepID=A0A0F9R2P9_9ZZZZ